VVGLAVESPFEATELVVALSGARKRREKVLWLLKRCIAQRILYTGQSTIAQLRNYELLLLPFEVSDYLLKVFAIDYSHDGDKLLVYPVKSSEIPHP